MDAGQFDEEPTWSSHHLHSEWWPAAWLMLMAEWENTDRTQRHKHIWQNERDTRTPGIIDVKLQLQLLFLFLLYYILKLH